MSWKLDTEDLRRNQFKRKNVLVKMQLVDIQYWDVGRFDMLGFGMVNESRIVKNRYSCKKFVLLVFVVGIKDTDRTGFVYVES